MDSVETEVRNLACALDEEELAERAAICARQLQRRAEIERSLAQQKASHKAQLEQAASELAQALDEYRTREAMRPVVCEVRCDFVRGVREVTRTDTGAVISQRDLTPEERQQRLFELRRAEGSGGELGMGAPP